MLNFKEPYNKDSALIFLGKFLPEDFRSFDEDIKVGFKTQFIQSAHKIGESSSLDVKVYEIRHASENDPRVSLSRETFRLLAQYECKRALIFFVSNKSPNYRFSLATIELRWEEGNRVKKEYSNPRRYSFFLGPASKTHTPEEYLIKKGRIKDFADLACRFSVEVVNKDFYEKIAILFTKLAGGERRIGEEAYKGSGVLHLPSTADDTLKKEFAIRLIGRLVFCWFLKKKHSDTGLSLLPEELVSFQAVTEHANYYHSILEPLFFEVLNTSISERDKKYQCDPWTKIPFLNGGLFSPDEHDFYDPTELGISKFVNVLKVPDSWISELFCNFETYNFTIDENTSVDVELSIDPEMLGRIFENLLAEVNPETGETARKATGSYYTPRPIVEYMVDESLKQYLLVKVKIDEGIISRLLSYGDDVSALRESEKDVILDALDSLRIIDPACGSGAFPMGILHKMLFILQKIDPDSQKWIEKKLSQIESVTLRKELGKKLRQENWNYVHKLGIIQSSIYGVDIQPIAAEISRLRFFLSLIVDEKVEDSKPNRGIDPLPNLEFKFVCANSLIPLIEESGELFDNKGMAQQMQDVRERFFKTDSPRIKAKMKKGFESLLKKGVSLFASKRQKQLLTYHPFDVNNVCSFFDSKFMFGVSSFDIVIANPPYVQIKQIPWDNRKVYDTLYKSAVGRFNLFYFFIELVAKLAKQGGLSVFIVPDRLLLNTQCNELRNWLLSEMTILEIDSFDESVFDSAVVDSIIIFYINSKHKCKTIKVKDRVGVDNLAMKKPIEIPITYFSESPSNQFDLRYDPKKACLIRKIRHEAVELGEIAEVRDGIIQSRIPDKLFLKKRLDEDSKKLLFGKNVIRYCVTFDNNWVNYKPDEMMKIERTRVEGAPGLRLRNKEIFERAKILTRQTADEIIAAYDDANYYYSNTLHGTTIIDKNYDPLYVLAVLNCLITTWYYRSTTAEGGKVFAQIKIEILKKIPISKATSGEQKAIVNIVKMIRSLTADSEYSKDLSRQAKVKECERQIDQMVYELYNLTPNEIDIVEKGLAD